MLRIVSGFKSCMNSERMASNSGNSFQNTKEGCESKESLLFGLEAEPTGEEQAAMASSSQSFEGDCDWKNSLPVGFRFMPTDEELLGFYLHVKKFGGGIIYDNIIKDLDIYQHEPSQLQNFAYDHGDGKMYFYSPLHRKYANGGRAKRDAPGGFWKMSQKTSPVKNLGTKTPLAFYSTEHDPRGVKTQWLMQQFRLTDTKHPKQTRDPNKLLEEHVICVVYYKKNSAAKSSDDGDDQSSMPSKEVSSLNLGEASCSYSVSSPPSSCSNSVSSPFPEQYQNPNYKPIISSYNNLGMASCSNPQYTLCPNPTSNPYISIKPNTKPPIYPSHYASSSNYVPSPQHRPAMHMPFSSNSRPRTSSHPNFYATTTNSIMHTPNSYHRTQQLKMSTSGASFNPNFNMNPSFTQNSYQPSNSNFHGSNILSPTPSIDSYTSWDPINGCMTGNFSNNSIQNTGQCHIGYPNQMNHYSNLGITINAEQYPYNNPSPLVPLSNIITNMDNSMNPNHVFYPNSMTSMPNPGANLSMNYSTHPTINTSGPSPSPNPSTDSSIRPTANLDPSGLNKPSVG